MAFAITVERGFFKLANRLECKMFVQYVLCLLNFCYDKCFTDKNLTGCTKALSIFSDKTSVEDDLKSGAGLGFDLNSNNQEWHVHAV